MILRAIGSWLDRLALEGAQYQRLADSQACCLCTLSSIPKASRSSDMLTPHSMLILFQARKRKEATLSESSVSTSERVL